MCKLSFNAHSQVMRKETLLASSCHDENVLLAEADAGEVRGEAMHRTEPGPGLRSSAWSGPTARSIPRDADKRLHPRGISDLVFCNRLRKRILYI